MGRLEEVDYDALVVRLARVRNSRKSEKLIPEPLREYYQKASREEQEALLGHFANLGGSKRRWDIIMDALRGVTKPLDKSDRMAFWGRLYGAAWQRSGRVEAWLLDLLLFSK